MSQNKIIVALDSSNLKEIIRLTRLLKEEVHAFKIGYEFFLNYGIEGYNKVKKIDPKKNCVIGFGITKKTISSLKEADGLVVGSAICKEITKSLNKRQNLVTNVGNIVKQLRNKIT